LIAILVKFKLKSLNLIKQQTFTVLEDLKKMTEEKADESVKELLFKPSSG
jgi:hypothetical protein